MSQHQILINKEQASIGSSRTYTPIVMPTARIAMKNANVSTHLKNRFILEAL